MTDAANFQPRGLTEADARARLEHDGPNELAAVRKRSLAIVVLDVLREPMLLMLLAGGSVYLLLGDVHEAVMLIVFAAFSVFVTIIQEARSERALAALRSIASPRALVIREGRRRSVAAREIVRGDLVVLAEGDRVAADGWIIENDGLLLEESLLTGESVPVGKKQIADHQGNGIPRPGGEEIPYVFAGTLVVGGGGLTRVAATGALSEMGRIGGSLALLETGAPRLYRETRRLVLLFALGAGVAIVAAVLLYGLMRGSWLEAALAGIALGMSLLPEEFPVVLAIFLAMGALRMSRVHVLLRRAAAIETLGAATVLCTDKTGTLTENRMQVAELRLPDGSRCSPFEQGILPPDFRRLTELGVLASAVDPFDPMEIAFHDLASEQNGDGPTPVQAAAHNLKRHYPLEPSLLAVSRAWALGEEADDHVIASKGAPEAIAELCGLNEAARTQLRPLIDAMAGKGLRVLGVAEARWQGSDLPSTHRAFAFEFRGLVGLRDPLRSSVPAAVRDCRNAGIRVVMITGDYPETARAIAQAAGIDAHDVMTGQMLDGMDDAELEVRAREIGVFARILPEQKLRIVEALKRGGEIVGMTGDGVNDAPSLKAADIGIAMGKRGSEVAREAAAIVLLDDDFGSIAAGVRMGRRIYDNLEKAMGFIVAVHIPIAGMALIPLVFGLPILLGPVHIALLEMIIDPVCSIAFEAETEEPDIMRRPPRSTRESLLSRQLIGRSILQGGMALIAVSAVLFMLVSSSVEPAELRSTVFIALVVAVIALVLANRSFSASLSGALARPNPALAAVMLLVLLLLGLAETVPMVGRMLGFAAITLPQAMIALGTGVVVLILLEGSKHFLTDRPISRSLQPGVPSPS